MRSLGRATCVTATLLCAWPTDAGAQQGSPREEIEGLALRLDHAVRQVSLPGSEPLLGVDPPRGYYVAGVGAMFVVPPRALPRPTRVLLFGPGRAPVVVEAPDDQAELEALLGPTEARRLSAARRRQRSAHERALDQRAEEFRRWAAEAGREMEVILEHWMRGQVLVPGRSGPGLVSDSVPAPGTTLPGLDADAAAPGTPGPPPAGALPVLPRDLFPEPTDPVADAPADARSPDRIVNDVRQAVVAALEAYGAGLRSVRADEIVSVAVDFVPRGLFSADLRPARTLVVRVSKKALDERAAGRLDSAAFLKQVQLSEY